jgi:hypothetical protein
VDAISEFSPSMIGDDFIVGVDPLQGGLLLMVQSSVDKINPSTLKNMFLVMEVFRQ